MDCIRKLDKYIFSLYLALLVIAVINSGKNTNIDLGDLASFFSMCIAAFATYFSYRQWQKVKEKIVMIDEHSIASDILPTWYTQRMMTDNWKFGLLLTSGQILAINRILRVSTDGNWLDVELLVADEITLDNSKQYLFAISEDRTESSVQVSQIISAFELAST